jgi:hypothetical protein
MIEELLCPWRAFLAEDSMHPLSSWNMLTARADAYELLERLGAPDRLVGHAQLVSQAADSLLEEFWKLGASLDVLTIELGAVLHDAGKIDYPEELSAAGSLHELAGESLLLKNCVQPAIAHCCVSHGVWNAPDVSLEERIVALADKLWKGKREADLELLVIDETATRLGA